MMKPEQTDLKRAMRFLTITMIVGVVLSIGFPLPSWAQVADEKPTGFQVLTIGAGPRAVALGETMVSGGDDPFVTEYNPAGLTRVDRASISFAHNTYFLDTRGEYVAVAVPMGRWALGARAGYVGTSDIPRRTTPTENPLSYYDASDGIFQGAVAGPVDERLSVGVSAAWVVEHIDVETAHTIILGLGALYELRHNMTLGASFVNVGPPAKFIEDEFQMPNQLRLGGGWNLGKVTARAELVAASRQNVRWHFGGEYDLDPRFTLRGGLKIGYDTQWFAAGFGARLPDGRLGIDYAFAPYTDDLGSTHRFGLTVRP